MKKRLLSTLLALCVVLLLLPPEAIWAIDSTVVVVPEQTVQELEQVTPSQDTASDVIDSGVIATHDIRWSLSADHILTIGPNGQGGTGEFPNYSYYDSWPWFKYRKSVQSIVLEEGITKIESGAFWECSATSVYLPSSLTVLNMSRYGGEYDSNTFSSCENLKEVIINPDNYKYASVDGVVYTKDMSKLITYPAGRVGAYVIPDGVTMIGNSAFASCAKLTDVVIPSSVNTIGNAAFFDCIGLSSIFLPDSIVEVGDNAFSFCINATDIQISNNLSVVKGFDGCSGVTSIVFPSGVTKLTDTAFSGCLNLNNVFIPKSVTSFGSKNGLFGGCSKMKDIYYEGSRDEWIRIAYADAYTSDDGDTFTLHVNGEPVNATIHYDCVNPNSGTEKNVSGILRSGEGWVIRWKCTYLLTDDGEAKNGRVDITVNSTNSDDELYLYNEAVETGFPYPWEMEPYNIPKSAIEKIIIRGQPDKRLRVPTNAFKGYSNLETIVFDYVSGVDSNAFAGCTSLQFVGFLSNGSAFSSIGEGAFQNCTSLTEIDFPFELKRIGARAFQNTAIGEVTLGSGIEEIGDDAFAGCRDLLIRCYKSSMAHRHAVENNIPFELIDGFTLGRDNNSFSHNSSNNEDGFYGISNYTLNDALYNRLTQGQSAKDKSEMKKHMREKWGGSCYGIAATMALVHDRILQLPDITTAAAISYYNLPLPYSDTKLLNSINYYQLSQYVMAPTVSHQNTDSYKSLPALINLLKEDQIVVLCYGYTINGKGHGHAILACDVIQQSNGVYTVKLYDENCSPRNERFIDMTISADLTSFQFTDSNGNLINNSTCNYLEVTHTSGLYSVKPYAAAYSDVSMVTVVFPMNVSFSLESEQGESLAYSIDDGFSGTMTIHSVQAISNDENSYWKITVPEGDSFTVSNCSSEFEIDIYSDDDFLSIGGEGISSAGLNLGSSITINDGVDGDYSFIAYISTDTLVGENETNLISIAGSASDAVTVSYIADENQVIAESEDAITNATMHSLIQTDILELSDQNSDDSIISVTTNPGCQITTLADPQVGGRVWIQGVDSNSSSGTYEKGASVTVVAEANSGYRFVRWNENDQQVSTSATYTFKAEESRTLTAVFENDSGGSPTPSNPSVPSTSSGGSYSSPTYSITTQPVTGGKLNVSPVSASSGSIVTVTATPDTGHQLISLTVSDADGKALTLTDKGNGKYTFTMPSSKITVDAVFKPTENSETMWSNPFTDVSESAWYYDAVRFAHENGLMNGYRNNIFAPDANLSRAMLAQILYNRDGHPAVSGSTVFSDVAPDAWYSDAIAWAAEREIVSGYGKGLFGPSDDITREQLAVMLWRYAGKPAATDKEMRFSDANSASDYALDALRWAVENGIINGKGNGILDPQGPATRAQVAQMLMNYMKK